MQIKHAQIYVIRVMFTTGQLMEISSNLHFILLTLMETGIFTRRWGESTKGVFQFSRLSN